MSASTDNEPSLRRVVTLPWLVLYGLGTTIGAGIYALTGVVAERAGLFAPASFLFACLIALFTALSFAELSSRYPEAGGEAVYVHEATGWAWLSSLVGLLIVVAGLVSAATIGVAFAGYLAEFVALPRLLAVVCVTALVGLVAGWGIRESVVAAGVLTLVEVGGLVAVIGSGGHQLAELPARATEFVPPDAASWGLVGSVAVLAFYAFLGFEDMVNVAEEVHDVRRVLPRGILITLGLTALLYVLVTSVAVLTVEPEELGRTEAPLALVFERNGGSAALLGLVALLALLNGALVQVIKASRVLFGLAGRGLLPAWLGRINRRTRTPLVATWVSTLVVAILAATLPLATLAETTSLVTLGTFALANLSLIIVKRRARAPSDCIVVPMWVPHVGLALNVALIGFEALRFF